MFYYSRIGKNGRLGNQMFQYATLFALGKLRNIDVAIPLNNQNLEEYHGEFKPLSLTTAFPGLSAKRFSEATIAGIYKEPDFSFSQNVFLLTDGCDIDGYFQSPHYFSFYREEVKKEFTFDADVILKCAGQLANIKQTVDQPICALHIRMGDYTNLADYHTNLWTTEYYEKAVSYITQAGISNTRFVIFSDNIQWCKDNIAAPENTAFVYSSGKSQIEDMCLMTMCDFHIIANSSFSWWGAWLSDSRLTIAPKQWFGPLGPKDWSSIYEKNWRVI